ncbi:unnamed protein product [Urochloa humidicola]
MATEQAVEDLVALNPCNPDILNDLEKFVNDQVNSGHQPRRPSPSDPGLAAPLHRLRWISHFGPQRCSFTQKDPVKKRKWQKRSKEDSREVFSNLCFLFCC